MGAGTAKGGKEYVNIIKHIKVPTIKKSNGIKNLRVLSIKIVTRFQDHKAY